LIQFLMVVPTKLWTEGLPSPSPNVPVSFFQSCLCCGIVLFLWFQIPPNVEGFVFPWDFPVCLFLFFPPSSSFRHPPPSTHAQCRLDPFSENLRVTSVTYSSFDEAFFAWSFLVGFFLCQVIRLIWALRFWGRAFVTDPFFRADVDFQSRSS